MDLDSALGIVRDAACKDDGTWVLLRLGQDPGADRILQLRTALRQLWRHLKDASGIPHPIGYAAGAILHFADEVRRNLAEANTALRPELLADEVPDLVQCAFNLLAGPDADTWDAYRPDLGD